MLEFKNMELIFFVFFFPGGTSIALAFLLVPIELISYIFKPISLSVRLFANMMAGHTLLKVIAGFCMVYAFCRWIIIYFPHSTFSHYRYSNGFRARCCSNPSLCIFYFKLYLLK